MAAKEWASLLGGLALAGAGLVALAASGPPRCRQSPAAPPVTAAPAPVTVVPPAADLPAAVEAVLAGNGPLEVIDPSCLRHPGRGGPGAGGAWGRPHRHRRSGRGADPGEGPMSRPRRLPALRLARIGGWTAVATAGVAVAMTRFSGPAEVPAAPAAEPAPSTPVTATTTTGAALPAAPAGGLLVLHLSPTPGVPVAAVTTPTTAAVGGTVGAPSPSR